MYKIYISMKILILYSMPNIYSIITIIIYFNIMLYIKFHQHQFNFHENWTRNIFRPI